ncbi:unnamed protein product [marine sediment metagenome]|uniref:CN hydrolase domain-containing protein n=1 Tax=marine sediment metagenome TaxID=412755 RepID=X1FUV5_9ZZZZ
MRKLRVAAVSTRNWVGEADRSIKNMARWARKAAGEGAELICFPELGVNGYLWSDYVWDIAETVPGPSTDKLVELAGEVGAVLCFGIAEREADIVYNTQVLVRGDGIIGRQRKIHMPGREYLYWRSGFAIDTFDIGKARLGITICYDSLFSEMCRTLFFKGAEVLIMPFAYATGPRSKFPERDISALTYRVHCNSNGCYGIVVNNAGSRKKSRRDPFDRKFPGWAGVFGPDGSIVAFTRQRGNAQAMVLADLDPKAIAKRRRGTYFVPRCLRPDMYCGIEGHQP